MTAPRVAVIIEDDKDIRDLIVAVLSQSGFEVHSASKGAEGVEEVRRHQPTLITLDLGLPDIDGFEVARRVRQFSDAYIIMLTARAEELDTLLGLEAGADDYLTKPFRPRELRARAEAMLRRPRPGAEPEQEEDRSGRPDPASAVVASAVVASADAQAQELPGTTLTEASPDTSDDGGRLAGDGVLRHNGLQLSPRTRTVEIESSPLELTRTEFDLLYALLEAGRVVRTKADLVRRLRYEEYDTGSFITDADERAIEVHIGNLRRKLGDDSRAPRWLETVRGVGYRLAPKTIR